MFDDVSPPLSRDPSVQSSGDEAAPKGAIDADTTAAAIAAARVGTQASVALLSNVIPTVALLLFFSPHPNASQTG